MLIGFDGRPGASDALAFAKALCETTSVELLVASVRPYWPELLGADDYTRAIREDEHWIRREAGDALDGLSFSVRVLAGGHEAGGLTALAAADDIDLIVVGASHRSPIGHVFPGSIGERVLSDAPCAVAVASRELARSRMSIRRIAVGFDRSRESRAALDTAIELAERLGASLRVLGVVESDVAAGSEDQMPARREKERVRRHLDRALMRMPRAIAVDARVLHGSPGHAIAEAAEDADLLVVGSHGRYGAAQRRLLGSVAARVVRSAPCSTLVTPAV